MFPVFYCLMTNKTIEAYQDVFKFIEAKSFELNPASIMSDYEEGMRIAIKNTWPNCDIRGCLFHYKQAIQRRCNADPILRRLLKLKNSFNARKIKNMLMNIPHLPEDKIMEGYESVRDFAKKKKLYAKFEELFSYFERQWLCQVRYTFYILVFICTKFYCPSVRFAHFLPDNKLCVYCFLNEIVTFFQSYQSLPMYIIYPSKDDSLKNQK